MTLGYGEGGGKARGRLLHKLASQNEDVSFLSFPTPKPNVTAYLPGSKGLHFVVARCMPASGPALVSHFGIIIGVRPVNDTDSNQKLLQCIEQFKEMELTTKESL
jgi:hypothetical protein